ncbi:MAG TPA: hypothetical protein VH595_13400 [Verrucomicrobiae bacterium]|nr:hypothetical protein [Verrucomicrobiae bacterium]
MADERQVASHEDSAQLAALFPGACTMNDDELKKLWREQPLVLPAELTGTVQLAALRKRMKRFDRNIWWRDLREVAACVVIVIWFGSDYFKYPQAVTRAVPGASVMDSLRVELRKVETQIHLLRSVLWWYILPSLGGSGVFFFGVRRNASARLVTIVVFGLVGVFVYWLNQRAVRQYLLPLKSELETLVGGVSEDAKQT